MHGVDRGRHGLDRLYTGMRRWVRALVLLVAILLAGCGESGSSSNPTSTSNAAATSSRSGATHSASGARVAAIAWVSGRPIAKTRYEHWLSVERALGAGPTASHRAVGFLVSSAWLLREAAGRGVSVSETQATQHLDQLKRQSFPQAGGLKSYLAKAHETEADLLQRVEVELLQSRLALQVTAGQSQARRSAILARFQRSFQQRWKSRTTCATGYVMEDCSEYRGKPENLTTTSSLGAASSGSASSASTGGSSTRASSSRSTSGGAANVSGEVHSAPGAMAISSPAFQRNGAIPVQYTCDGANTSPPLQWQNLPAKTAALVLFVIDDTSTGPAGGIRWVVGDISPSATGVAAGATPEGGIVGSDTQGHVGYGGICPERGKTSTVEFVLYALSKKIPLSPGFTPAVAESEYGSGKDLLGSAAVTYAVYHRP
jgi:phosphatidylethanolamine-binding protein (PEBP) family uncharacterized protein